MKRGHSIDLIAPESTGRCLKCHSVNSVSGEGLVVNWQTRHGVRSLQNFTHFSHKPQLTLLSSEVEVHAIGNSQRCETCHALSQDSFDLINHAFRTDDSMPNSTESMCSALDVISTQRQNCTQCHNDHVHGPTTEGPLP